MILESKFPVITRSLLCRTDVLHGDGREKITTTRKGSAKGDCTFITLTVV
jgi:hypothetical protein